MVERICPFCERKFQTDNKTRIYCSERCKDMERRRLQRARHGTVNLLYLKGKTRGCRGCVDFEGYTCEYLRNNGHCRPCKVKPDGGCDLYSPVARRRAAEDERRSWDTTKAKKLLRSGLTAAETAKKLGCSPNSVKAWINHKEVQTR